MAKTKRILATYWKDYVIITLGLIIFSISFVGLLKTNHLIMGGLGGISLLLAEKFKLELWISYTVINSILLICAWFILGKQYILKSLYGIVVVSVAIAFAEKIITKNIMAGTDPMMIGVIGGICCGVGLGMVYSRGASTGGTDIIGAIITKYRYISMGRGLMYVDFIIVSSSFLIFQDIKIIITGLIIVIVMYNAVDIVLNGAKQSVQFIIFSKKYDKIASHINLEMHRGCTILDGTGWYSKDPQKVIILLARKTESSSIFRIVKYIDKDAFISQSNVVGVYGQGFDQMK